MPQARTDVSTTLILITEGCTKPPSPIFLLNNSLSSSMP